MLEHAEGELEKVPVVAEGVELDVAAAGLLASGGAVETATGEGRLPLACGQPEGAAPLQGNFGERHPCK